MHQNQFLRLRRNQAYQRWERERERERAFVGVSNRMRAAIFCIMKIWFQFFPNFRKKIKKTLFFDKKKIASLFPVIPKHCQLWGWKKSRKKRFEQWAGMNKEKIYLPDRESNPGLPRDRRRSSPLDYRGIGGCWPRKAVEEMTMSSKNSLWRSWQDSNLCSQRETDFESVALTTRPQLLHCCIATK